MEIEVGTKYLGIEVRILSKPDDKCLELADRIAKLVHDDYPELDAHVVTEYREI